MFLKLEQLREHYNNRLPNPKVCLPWPQYYALDEFYNPWTILCAFSQCGLAVCLLSKVNIVTNNNFFLCRSCAQRRHSVHSRAGKLRGLRARLESSPRAAEAPAFSLPAAQWSLHLPALWHYGWETAACTQSQNTVFRLAFLTFCFASIRGPPTATEALIERHLEAILNNNRKAVTAALQIELRDTLKVQNHRKKASLTVWEETFIIRIVFVFIIPTSVKCLNNALSNQSTEKWISCSLDNQFIVEQRCQTLAGCGILIS